MRRFLLIFFIMAYVFNITGSSELDDKTLKDIERINEIMYLIRNFYVEERDVSDIFTGAALGMIRGLGGGARVFSDYNDYEDYIKSERRVMDFGFDISRKAGWFRVISVHEHGLFKALKLFPGDVLYSIGDVYLDDVSREGLIFLLYRAILKDDNLKLTLRRANENIPSNIELDFPPDYTAYDISCDRVREIEEQVLQGNFDLALLDSFVLKREYLIDHTILNDLSIITISSFREDIAELFNKYVKEANGSSKVLALDLRNAGAYGFDDIRPFLNAFLNKENIGYYKLRDLQKEGLYIEPKDQFKNKLPMVIFVSRQTYWFAEYFVQLLKDHAGAYIIGENTFGRAEYRQLYSLLEDRYFLLVSTAVLYSSLNNTHYNEGVSPHKEINPQDDIYSLEEHKLFIDTAQQKISSLLNDFAPELL